jgi:hypothetical protein
MQKIGLSASVRNGMLISRHKRADGSEDRRSDDLEIAVDRLWGVKSGRGDEMTPAEITTRRVLYYKHVSRWADHLVVSYPR